MKLKLNILILCTAVLAVFGTQAQQFTLTIITNSPQGGTVSGAGTYAKGSTVPLEIHAKDGWYIAYVNSKSANYVLLKISVKIMSYQLTYSSDVLDYWLKTITDDSESIVPTSDLTLTVQFSPLTSLAIVTQPTNQSVFSGETVTFAVTAKGGQPISYQWKYNGSNIASTTSPSLVLSNVQLSNAGRYSLVASNNFGVTNSAPAVLEIKKDIIVSAFWEPVTNSVYSAADRCPISLESRYANGNIFYTLDGTEPDFSATPYKGYFYVSSTCTVRAIAYSQDFSQSVLSDPVTIDILPSYPLSISSDGGGSVRLDPSQGSFVSNTVVKVIAQPSPGWVFMGWLGALNGNGLTNSLIMNGQKQVKAVFGTPINTTIAGKGTVSVYPNFPAYPYGSTVLLSAMPNPGNSFGVWSNAGNGSQNPLAFTVTMATPSISALFAALPANQLSLAVLREGGGVVSVSPYANRYQVGATNVLTAIPTWGQRFVNWSGDADGSENPLPVVMDKSKTITAHFTRTATLGIAKSDTGVDLWISGLQGDVYNIESSTNLATWVPFMTATNIFGTVNFSDSVFEDTPCRIYRAVMP